MLQKELNTERAWHKINLLRSILLPNLLINVLTGKNSSVQINAVQSPYNSSAGCLPQGVLSYTNQFPTILTLFAYSDTSLHMHF